MRRLRPLVRRGQVGPAFVPAGHQILYLAVLLPCLLGAGLSLSERLGQAACLFFSGGRLGARRLHLAAQPGELLGAGNGGPGVRCQPPIGLDQAGLGVGALLQRGGKPRTCCGEPLG